MSFTTEERDALRAALARGVLEVQQGDERVKYRSVAEMRETLRMMEAELGTDTRKIATSYPTLGRGL